MAATNENDTNPFAPPSARVADVAAQGGTLELAGRGARLGAYFIDMIVLMLTAGLAAGVFGFLGAARISLPEQSGVLMVLWSLLVIFLFLLINGYYLVRRGQSLGKMAIGIRIVRSDGSPVDAKRVLGLRYALNWLLVSVPFIGGIYSLVDTLCIFRESRRCLHDDIADTIVVKA